MYLITFYHWERSLKSELFKTCSNLQTRNTLWVLLLKPNRQRQSSVFFGCGFNIKIHNVIDGSKKIKSHTVFCGQLGAVQRILPVTLITLHSCRGCFLITRTFSVWCLWCVGWTFSGMYFFLEASKSNVLSVMMLFVSVFVLSEEMCLCTTERKSNDMYCFCMYVHTSMIQTLCLSILHL